MAENTLEALQTINRYNSDGTLITSSKTFTEEQIAAWHEKQVIPSLSPMAQSKLGLGQAGHVPSQGVGNVVQRLTGNADLLNEYFEAYNQASVMLFNNDLFTHPLQKYKRAYSPMGGFALEQVFDAATEHKFNVNDGGSPFERANARMAEIVHKHRWSAYFEVTLQDTFSRQMFTTWTQFDQWLYGMMQSLYNGVIIQEYNNMKRALSLAVYMGDSIMDAIVDPTPADILKSIKYHARNMANQPTDYYNKLGYYRQPAREKLSIITTSATGVDIDVDVLANVYNLALATPNELMTSIDEFPSLWFYMAEHTVTADDLAPNAANHGEPNLDPREFKVGDIVPTGTMARENAAGATKVFDGSNVKAAVLNKDFFVFIDQLMADGEPKIASIVDPRHRSTNVFGHVEQIESVSPAQTNVFITAETGDAAIVIAEGKGYAGGDLKINAPELQIFMDEDTIVAQPKQ